MHPQATIIIPQYNHAHLTIACLQSLRRHEPTPVEIIVIDDGSDPDALQSFDSLHLPSFKPLQQRHAGVTVAWNVAANEATTPKPIFLNNDTLCHGPIVERLITPLDSTAILTGSTLRHETALPPEILSILPTQLYIEGWCMAILRSDFESIGGFDESMQLYFSDTDLQARLLQADPSNQLRLQPVPDLHLRHRAHQTTRHHPARRKTWQADRRSFIKKWANQAHL